MVKKHKKAKPRPPGRRNANRGLMLRNLILSGRRIKCEITNCNCIDPGELEIHHIMPVSFKPIHNEANLAILCKDHHALVERYYFHKRSLLMPDTAAKIQELARQFKARAVPLDQVADAKRLTKELWSKFNNAKDLRDDHWWKSTWSSAKTWASNRTILTKVAPKNAIVSEAWYE